MQTTQNKTTSGRSQDNFGARARDLEKTMNEKDKWTAATTDPVTGKITKRVNALVADWHKLQSPAKKEFYRARVGRMRLALVAFQQREKQDEAAKSNKGKYYYGNENDDDDDDDYDEDGVYEDYGKKKQTQRKRKMEVQDKAQAQQKVMRKAVACAKLVDGEQAPAEGRGASGKRGNGEDGLDAAIGLMKGAPAMEELTPFQHKLAMAMADMQARQLEFMTRLSELEQKQEELKRELQTQRARAQHPKKQQLDPKDVQRLVRRWTLKTFIRKQGDIFHQVLFMDRVENGDDVTIWLKQIKSTDTALYAQLAPAEKDKSLHEAIFSAVQCGFADGRQELRKTMVKEFEQEFLSDVEDPVPNPNLNGRELKRIQDKEDLRDDDDDDDDDEEEDEQTRKVRQWKQQLVSNEVPSPNNITTEKLTSMMLDILKPETRDDFGEFQYAFTAFHYERWYNGQNLQMTSKKTTYAHVRDVTARLTVAAVETIHELVAQYVGEEVTVIQGSPLSGSV